MPKVTVLMPVYNAAEYIKEAINSILNQTFDDFEFLIFNDGSTDNSADIVKSYNDERIKFYDYDQNQGHVYHLNHGIEIARGEYIARMDADDISLPRRFEKQVEFMDTNPNVGVCGTWFKIMDSQNEIRHPIDNTNIRLALLDYCAIGHPTVMLRKTLLKESGIRYETALCPAEDYWFWVFLSSFCELANLPEVFLEYRIHQNQISNYRRQEQEKISQDVKKYQIEALLGRILTDTEMSYCSLMFKETIVPSCSMSIEDIVKWINLLRNSNRKKHLYKFEYFDKWLLDILIYMLNTREANVIRETQLQLQKSQDIIQKSQDIISTMKSSKFWKLREKWFAIKRKFKISEVDLRAN